MLAILLTEIVSALVAAAAVLAIAFAALRARVRGREESPIGRWHAWAGALACAAGLVHGTAAVAYGSGAPTAAYAFGWTALIAFVLSGSCGASPVRAALPWARALHGPLFLLGIALVIAHAVAAHL